MADAALAEVVAQLGHERLCELSSIQSGKTYSAETKKFRTGVWLMDKPVMHFIYRFCIYFAPQSSKDWAKGHRFIEWVMAQQGALALGARRTDGHPRLTQRRLLGQRHPDRHLARARHRLPAARAVHGGGQEREGGRLHAALPAGDAAGAPCHLVITLTQDRHVTSLTTPTQYNAYSCTPVFLLSLSV